MYENFSKVQDFLSKLKLKVKEITESNLRKDEKKSLELGADSIKLIQANEKIKHPYIALAQSLS